MTTVNVRTLKDKLSEYLDRAQKGESIAVTRRGEPAAWLIPAETAAVDRERRFRELVASGTIRLPKNPGGWSKARPLKLRGKGKLPSEMILEERRSARF